MKKSNPTAAIRTPNSANILSAVILVVSVISKKKARQTGPLLNYVRQFLEIDLEEHLLRGNSQIEIRANRVV